MTTTPAGRPIPVPIPPDVPTVLRVAIGYLEAYGWRDDLGDEGTGDGITLAQALALGCGGAPVPSDTVEQHRQRFELGLRAASAIRQNALDDLMYARGRSIAVIRRVLLMAAGKAPTFGGDDGKPVRRHAVYGVTTDGKAYCACGVSMPEADIDQHVTDGNR